ncbi:MAG: hypothetical protein Q9209_003464 [Squamulea sp. 1 TL-2023]
MASALSTGQMLVGRTGVSYHLEKVLYERLEEAGGVKVSKNSIWLARSEEKSYVIKPVTLPFYKQAFDLRTELSSNPYIRFPVDGIESGVDNQLGLVFDYYTESFLHLRHGRQISRTQVKRILFDILKGIFACHSKGWVHCDVKPSNVMVSHKTTKDGHRDVERVVLIDMESAAKLKKGQAIFGQALYGITRMVVFAYDKLEEGVPPEVEVLSNQLSYFGPLTQGLLKLMGDSPWGQVLLCLNNGFDEHYPAKPFYLWKDIDGLEPGDKEFFLHIMRLDPKERPTAAACSFSYTTPSLALPAADLFSSMAPHARLIAAQLIKTIPKGGATLAIEYATQTTHWNRVICSPQLQADFAAVAEAAKDKLPKGTTAVAMK